MLLLYLFLTIPTHAIRDTNQNAVSDLWERKNNSGNLMVDFDPTADPDGDGWTNEQEAVTGTNPLDANAPVGFIQPHIEYIPAVYITPEVEGGEPEILSPEITTITWPTLAGKLYTLFASTDLSPGSWTTIGTPNLGRGTEIAIAISLSQSDGGIPERLFLRVSVLDIDQDSDTLTNAEEAELGSLPYSADGDNDGLNDLEELFTYQTHPVSRDSDGDGVSDPDEILVNFTNPLTAADADGDGIPDDFEKYFAKQLLVYQADSSAWGTHYAGLVAGNLNATYDYTGDGMSVRELAEILKKIAAAGPAASGYHLEQQGRRNSIPWAYYFSSSSSSSSEGIYSHSVPNDYDVRISITPTADLSSQYLLSRIDGVPWSGSYITPGDQMNFFNGMVESAFRSTPVMSPNGTKFQGRISQQRSRLVATHPGHEAYSKTYLKVVENSHYFTYDHNGVITVEPITVEVPKGKMLSDWCEFKAPVVSESDGRSAELRLLQVDVAVDADRDGEITFDEKDQTTVEKPFRFWINNDQDDVEVDEPIIVEANNRDLLDSTIKTSRDLEDFTRVKIRVGIPLQQLQEGKFKIGLKFKDSAVASPAIRVWPNESDAGSLDYLDDTTAASRQRSKPLIGDTLNGTTFIPDSYWSGRSDSQAHLIFEGVRKGKGELVLVVKHEILAEVESASIHLNLLDVREMYQRARIVNEPEAIPHPWDSPNPPAQAWSWDPWSWAYSEDPGAEPITAVFVHGWRLKYMDFMNWSDTSYKRLWHQGFKGKFYSFRWASFSGDNNGLPYGLDEELEDNSGGSSIIIPPGGLTYNASEYRAWLCGPALASFVNQLPNPGKRSLFAHSMGNVISGAALRSGMLVDFYAMCNSAVAAMAYDPTRIHPDYVGYKTPDTDHDPAIRNGYGLASKFSGLANMPQIFNFSLPADEALKGWLSNNKFFKADFNNWYWYKEYPEPNTTYRLYHYPGYENFRNVTGLSEAMGYVTQSRSLPAGADLLTSGSVNNAAVDMTSWGFGKTHSAVWRWSNQKSHLFWVQLVEKIELKPQD